jgi:conjugal transfer pilus assembly protein TraW
MGLVAIMRVLNRNRLKRPGLLRDSLRGFSLVIVLSGSSVCAQEVLHLGPTYDIGEPHFLKDIEAKLRAKEKSGELKKLEQEAIARSLRSIEAPRPIEGVVSTVQPRSFNFDPTVMVPSDVRLPDGRLLAAAGTRYNPLSTVNLSVPLFFFDGRDPAQAAMAKRFYDSRQGVVKLIMTAGSYTERMRAWKHPVFFDQYGALVGKLGITQVPARVMQDKGALVLRIDELAVVQ